MLDEAHLDEAVLNGREPIFRVARHLLAAPPEARMPMVDHYAHAVINGLIESGYDIMSASIMCSKFIAAVWVTEAEMARGPVGTS